MAQQTETVVRAQQIKKVMRALGDYLQMCGSW
jgi:hypothetical protein